MVLAEEKQECNQLNFMFFIYRTHAYILYVSDINRKRILYKEVEVEECPARKLYSNNKVAESFSLTELRARYVTRTYHSICLKWTIWSVLVEIHLRITRS